MNMEQQEFEEWVRRMRQRLLAEARQRLGDADEAEDTVQDAVLKLWAMRTELSQYHSMDGLGVVMVRRMALNKKRQWHASQQQMPLLADDHTPETALISREERERLEHLLLSLPSAQQAVLRMKHIDGMEVAEIARTTGSTPEAVRQCLSRARRNMMKQFKL